MTISFLEIYMEQITDLLLPGNTSSKRSLSPTPMRSSLNNPSTTSLQNLQIREDPKTGIFVHGLT